MPRIANLAWLLLLGSLLTTAGASWAQFPFFLDYRDPSTALKFSLSTPGARSLAMGGAFLGLADDATAAYTNPAGLTNLTVGGSEVAVEVRQARFTALFPDRGHYNTDPALPALLTHIGQDAIDGFQFGEAESETSGLSFLSVGYVLPRGLVLALYRHELGNYQSAWGSYGPFNDFDCSDNPSVPFTDPEGTPGSFQEGDCDLWRIEPLSTSVELEIVNYGVSMALALDLPLGGMESSLSLGLGLSYYELEMERIVEDFHLCLHDQLNEGEAEVNPSLPGSDQPICTLDVAGRRLPGAFFGPPDHSPDNSQFLTEEVGEDEAFGLNLGFLWKLGRAQRWSIGGVYREGPGFATVQRSGEREDFKGPARTFSTVGGQLKVPDVFGVGVAFRTAEGNTKVTFDVNRVRYSQTLVDFTRTLDHGLEFDHLLPEDYALDDVDQFHLGLERLVFSLESTLVGSARVGAWYEPFHEPQYVACVLEPNPDLGNCDEDLDALLRRHRPTDDEIHVSAGLGLVIREDYQIDIAVDFSDPVNTYSFSLVKFF